VDRRRGRRLGYGQSVGDGRGQRGRAVRGGYESKMEKRGHVAVSDGGGAVTTLSETIFMGEMPHQSLN
jgi:hypothetical protein